jgi:hypothetical protein
MNIINYFKINKKEIFDLNQKLIKNPITDKLNVDEVKTFSRYRNVNSDEHGISYWLYAERFYDQSKFCEISYDEYKYYQIKLQLYETYNLEKLKLDLENIIDYRDHIIVNDILKFDNFFKIGIELPNQMIFRFMKKPFISDTILSISSWSLIPLVGFTQIQNSHLYVTKIPKDLKVIYYDLDTKHNELYRDLLINFDRDSTYLFEVLLPRGIKFVEDKVEVIEFDNEFFNNKKATSTTTNIFVHYITIKEQILLPIPPLNMRTIKLVYD